MAQTNTSYLIRQHPRRLVGIAPPEGDYKYVMEGGYIHLVLISPRALAWFQEEVYADALDWRSPTEPLLPWGGEAAEVLNKMRTSGLRKREG